MSYRNDGPKEGNKGYLVVNGSRVYTGQKFDASDEDVKVLKERFNIKSYKREQKDIVSDPEDEVLKVADTPDNDTEFQTEEDALASASKTTKKDKGVK